jgi:hypothetical protein
MFRPQKFSLPPLRRSLSARLLLLTIFFVMLAEVLIYAPSVSNFRLTWLHDRLASADLAILALEAAPDENLSADLKSELLGRVDAFAVVLTRPDRRLLLYTQPPPPVEITVDLRQSSLMSGIGDAFGTLARRGDGVMRVIGESPQNPSMVVEVVLNEAQLRAEMFGYSRNILLLSIVISVDRHFGVHRDPALFGAAMADGAPDAPHHRGHHRIFTRPAERRHGGQAQQSRRRNRRRPIRAGRDAG